MIGDVGVFAGEWAAYDHLGEIRYPTGFIGRLDALRGREDRYAVFSCDRNTAEAIVAEQERLREETRQRLRADGRRGEDLAVELDLAYAPLYFADDEIVLDERRVHGEADGLSRICPDGDGRYTICGWQWEWRIVDPADCDRLVGTPPTAAEQPTRIPLRHSPLHVPHHRLTVTSLEETVSYTGVPFTATLCLDGTPVGRIENEGKGTWLRHHDPARFSRRDMHEFVLGCRFRRRPTVEETVLDRLVTEYKLEYRLTALSPNSILARTVNADGEFCGDVVDLESVSGLGRFDRADGWADLAGVLVTFPTRPSSVAWQAWHRGRWRPVPAPATPTDASTTTS
ncbi:hypothetical protein C1I95_23680 [Micromonospora craterilacus]|uniref:Uncharacterized protein n=2 Tax=Micromonospora craterilacus TaxID=1655439 RepID=A0A2W2EVQ4_9ACTN|nr:hypothetical protein C1I95_23680 [Micromonospora craterilacus]